MSATPSASADRIESEDVLDLLASLVQKSLVVYEEDEQGCGRYRLLETVRQYARDRLLEAGEAEAVRGRHRDWFLALAEEAHPELVGPRQAEWFQRLEREHDNLRAALDWSQAGESGLEEALRLAGALWWFWVMRDHSSEGLARLPQLLAQTEGAEPSRTRTWVLLGAANLTWWQGDLALARSRYEQAQALFELFGEKAGVARCLNDRGLMALQQGDLAAALALQEQALVLHRELGNPQGGAWTVFFLGCLAYANDDPERARRHIEDSLTEFDEIGEKHGVAKSLLVLGMFALEQGDAARARSLHEQSLALYRELGHQEPTAWPLLALGDTARAQGHDEAARSHYAECLTIFRHAGNKPNLPDALFYLRHAARASRDGDRVPVLFEDRQAILRELGTRGGVTRYLEERAGAVAPAAPARAARLLGAAEGLREAFGAPLPPADRAERDRSVAAVRTALGENAFAAAWAEGRALTLDQAVSLALKEMVY